MSDYAEQLADVVEAVEITSPTTFAWFGAPCRPLPARVRRALAADVARSHLLYVLRNHIYTNFYRVGFASRMAPETGESALTCQETQLTARLAAANQGAGSWEPGWQVRSCDNGSVAVHGRDLELWVDRSDCRPVAGELAPGAPVLLRLPSEACGASPGYYVALSDDPLVWDEGRTLVRLYWNVAPSGAADLVRGVTARLNGAGVPFRLKVLDNAISYARRDTAVLYLLRDDVGTAAPLLADVHAACRGALRPGVPAFTKPLASGLAVAEDPGTGQSFGEHRSELVAAGLIRAAGRARGDRLRVVVQTLREAGVALDRPYLRPGSADGYALPVDGSPAVPDAVRGGRDPDAALTLAAQIASRLAAEALWDRDRCSWLGLLPHAHGPHQISLSYGALGSDLYDGTSGIALFLAEMHCLTGDPALKRTAIGAVRQALGRARRGPLSLGLYSGSLGIALAVGAVGVLLAEEALVKSARGVARRAARAAAEGFDLLSGRAGGIVALLTLAELADDRELVALAARRGDELIATAEHDAAGWSWRSDDGVSHRNLTGLSHGAAGAAHALLELAFATGAERYVVAAEGALAYERTWFSAAAGNWPDFREQPRRRRPAEPGTFRTQWCHGAPGIALARLRAAELLGSAQCRDEARIALATTARETAAAVDDGSLSWCLCHGLAGNADVLLEGAELLDGAAAHVAGDIGEAGLAGYGRTGAPWPCGIPVPGRETPGLMLGLAGIGHFYARLARPYEVPSLLLVCPRDFRRRLEALALLQVNGHAPERRTGS